MLAPLVVGLGRHRRTRVRNCIDLGKSALSEFTHLAVFAKLPACFSDDSFGQTGGWNAEQNAKGSPWSPHRDIMVLAANGEAASAARTFPSIASVCVTCQTSGETSSLAIHRSVWSA
jgi:hypothetical protein